MGEVRHLAKAPITEAVIDFRVTLPELPKADWRPLLKEKLGRDYPVSEEGWRLEVTIGVKSTPSVKEDRAPYGYRFMSEDKLNVAQFRPDGFTFSRLKPYTHWKAFFRDACDLWGIYVDTALPELVTRIATRYINRISIPLPVRDLKDFLTAPPLIPDEAPKEMTSFFSRVVVRDPDQEVAANITQAVERNKDPNSITIILDIDAYKTGEFEVDDKRIGTTFEALHDLKNRIFFSSLTDDALRLFE